METGRTVIEDYLAVLSSKAPVPGGGGAAALAGALGASLASMVGELTVGKKKYADVEESVKVLIAKASYLRDRFLSLADADAEAFLPLSAAYSMPKENDDQKRARNDVMQKALVSAEEVPLRILRCSGEMVGLIEELLEKGSVLAISDVGVSALLLIAAAKSAALNVFINTKLMDDRELAGRLEAEVHTLLDEIVPASECVYGEVLGRITKK